MDEPSRAAPLIAKIAVPLLAAGAALAYVRYRQQAANPPPAPPTAEAGTHDPDELTAASGGTATGPQQTKEVATPDAGDGTASNDEIVRSPTIITGTKSRPIDLDLDSEQADQGESEALPFTFEGTPSRDPQIIAGSKSARILIDLDDEVDDDAEHTRDERTIIMGSKFGPIGIPRPRPDQATGDHDPDDDPSADDDQPGGEVP